MRRKVDLDSLIREAKRLGNHRTAKEAVETALKEYILKRRRLEVVELFGTIDFDESYDYKRERHRKRKPKQVQ